MRRHSMAYALQEQIKQPNMTGLAFKEGIVMLVDAQGPFELLPSDL